jgi:stress-induced morphogen
MTRKTSLRARLRRTLHKAFPRAYCRVLKSYGQRVALLVVDERFNNLSELAKIRAVIDALPGVTEKEWNRISSINVYGDAELHWQH